MIMPALLEKVTTSRLCVWCTHKICTQFSSFLFYIYPPALSLSAVVLLGCTFAHFGAIYYACCTTLPALNHSQVLTLCPLRSTVNLRVSVCYLVTDTHCRWSHHSTRALGSPQWFLGALSGQHSWASFICLRRSQPLLAQSLQIYAHLVSWHSGRCVDSLCTFIGLCFLGLF